VIIGHRDGPGSAYPLVMAGSNGVVFALWNDITDGETNGTKVFLGKSVDYGMTWNVTNITPFNMYSYYQSLAVDENGDLGVSFYATPDMPVSDNSSWYLYGAVQRNADISDINLNFSKASPDPVFVGARVDALGDLFESVFTPDNNYNIAFERRTGTQRFLFFVKGSLPDS